jgi:hypothetical protein
MKRVACHENVCRGFQCFAELGSVRWIGRRQVGKMRLWSCEGHAEGLDELHPIPCDKVKWGR